ncbi:glycosyltransferase family 2 protein [Rhodophyticola sp. CCM32]|uniref:glycosyltransferase family 2 protein n=1 Tax=Rhodophyticola sp. CCM32 TaxID=2916397 RepID=UPI00107EEBC3|nr:glycosyltransferase family 2 protein [Rhodophyticola sp. CCM32]QBY00703.1 glycosyltransferase family 2 protein [Rhodophyticola sp. CCM32]
MERITLVSVCFNSSPVIPAMLASLPENIAVVLVDNGSADVAEIEAMAEAHGATCVASPENLGFGRACNLGAARATTELILFLNPDTTLAPGAINALLAGADRYPQASAFNPAILSASGLPAFRRSSVLLPRHMWLPRQAPSEDTEVPILSGAALLVRRKAFDRIGGFDPHIFLYHEDDDLSLRLKAESGPLMYIHEARIHHSGGRSSPRSPEIAALKARHMGQSRVYAARKHGLPCPFVHALAVGLVQLLSPLMLLSARKRAKHWNFLRAVWHSRRATPLPEQP